MPVARTDDGVAIAYHTLGTGPRNLVFLHAWGASGSYFDETIECLDPNTVRAITLDLRGHGDSDKPEIDLTWERLARDVFAVADDAVADTFIAVGHSMGGKLAQFLPLVDPSRLEALVLVASPSAGELPIPTFVSEWVGLAGDPQAFIDTTVTPYLRRPVPEHVLRRFGQDAAKIPRAYLEWTLNLVSSTSFIEQLGSVRTPVLVVSSERDPVHSTERDIVASLPNARLEILDCGPEIPMELPVELAHVIEKFVAELPLNLPTRAEPTP
ncbi:MAG: alpha/beta hydrolase [Actinomycetota bacterium]